jgi:uncharacterized membrane protein
MTGYVLLKIVHILVAIISLGTSAGLGIALEFYARGPTHGSFLMRVVERLTAYVVIPGYVVVLSTGIWMARINWSFTAAWIRAALLLWAVGLVVVMSFVVTLRRQRMLMDAGNQASGEYKRAALFARVFGGAFGLVVVSILYFMVAKPAL